MEQFKKKYPNWRLVVTFFSPSGFEMRKEYPLADWVAYLPFDTHRNAVDWVNWLQPSLVVFVKYEIWPNYLKEVSRKGIPLYLIAASFRTSQVFFKWYGGYFRTALRSFNRIFVQTTQDQTLLEGIGYQSVEVTGDTRVDRVLEIAENALEDPIVANFVGDHWTLVVGSSWAPDEERILEALELAQLGIIRVVCAPHSIAEANLVRLEKRLGKRALRYSRANGLSEAELKSFSWLIVDNIGKLNTLYRYGAVAYIGGGFGAGIHNTLEPAAWGLPILFGPRYKKFEEAIQMIQRGAAFTIQEPEELAACLQYLFNAPAREQSSKQVRDYLQQSKGATGKILCRMEEAEMKQPRSH
jgi:3-deoxy-D-manno-octulosonic-acid transferase